MPNTDSRRTYCAVYKIERDKTQVSGVIVDDDVERIRSRLDTRFEDTPNDTDVDESDEQEEVESERDDEDSLLLDLGHFFDPLGRYYELSYISRTLKSVYSFGYFNSVLLKYAERLDKIDEHRGTAICEVPEYEMIEFQRKLSRWDDIQAGIDSFSPAVLLGVVASYDSLFGELFKDLLLLRPERYNRSDRQITVSDLLKLGSFDEVIEKVVTDEVDAITFKTHLEQVISFEKSFSISVKDDFLAWPSLVEIFERRNLAAHGDLRVDKRYLDNCRKANVPNTADLKVGDSLAVDDKYLTNALDVLIDFGTRLVFAAWVKQIPDQKDEAFVAAVNTTYELIKAKRFSVARSIAEFILNNYSKVGSEGDLKALTINRAISSKKLKDGDGARKILEDVDWTASAPIYRICVSAIKEDLEAVINFLPIIKATGEIQPNEFRDWPAFDWVRGVEAFSSAFEITFGEPLARASEVQTVTPDLPSQASA